LAGRLLYTTLAGPFFFSTYFWPWRRQTDSKQPQLSKGGAFAAKSDHERT
jgi:hypothetical protein